MEAAVGDGGSGEFWQNWFLAETLLKFSGDGGGRMRRGFIWVCIERQLRLFDCSFLSLGGGDQRDGLQDVGHLLLSHCSGDALSGCFSVTTGFSSGGSQMGCSGLFLSESFLVCFSAMEGFPGRVARH